MPIIVWPSSEKPRTETVVSYPSSSFHKKGWVFQVGGE